MARYATLNDAVDPSLFVLERHLLKADVYVDAKLIERGIALTELTLPIALLTEIAATWALRMAAIEGAIDVNSPLISKAREYEKTAETLVKSISREALGLTQAASGFGSFTIGRA
jgi:ABC-type cobalamin transport system permease subunit